jgi:hypothetical protein
MHTRPCTHALAASCRRRPGFHPPSFFLVVLAHAGGSGIFDSCNSKRWKLRELLVFQDLAWPPPAVGGQCESGLKGGTIPRRKLPHSSLAPTSAPGIGVDPGGGFLQPHPFSSALRLVGSTPGFGGSAIRVARHFTFRIQLPRGIRTRCAHGRTLMVQSAHFNGTKCAL